MKNTFGKVLLVALMVGPVPARAFFGNVVYDPTAVAKMVQEGAVRASEAARELQVQMNQLNTLVRNTMSLADPVFKPVGDMARTLSSGYWQLQSLKYQAQNAGSMFNTMYPNYNSYLYTMGTGRPMSETMPSIFQKWSDASYENTRDAMTAAGLQVNNMKTEQEMIESLARQADSADGQAAKMQAAAQIAAFQSRQLGDLGALMAKQITMQANYMAQENERRIADQAANQQYKGSRVTNSPAKGY